MQENDGFHKQKKEHCVRRKSGGDINYSVNQNYDAKSEHMNPWLKQRSKQSKESSYYKMSKKIVLIEITSFCFLCQVKIKVKNYAQTCWFQLFVQFI